MGWSRKKNEFNKRTYPDVMVDLETMGTSVDTQVLSIGAVRFRMGVQDDVTSILERERGFYAVLDIDEQADKGRTTTSSTLDWWANQSKEARAVFEEPRQDVATVLDSFSTFCDGAKRIWGNGNMFDNAIMRSLYDTYDRNYPVEYWKDLDVRTLTWLWNFLTDWRSKGKRPTVVLGEEHNALDDARRQTLQVQLMLKELKGSKYES